MRAFVSLAVVLVPVLAAAQPRTDDRPKVGVLKFTEVNVTPEFSSTVATAVANELDRTGAFRLTTAEAIGELLALERQRQLLGCGADESCMTEIVDALGLDFIVSGKVVKTGAGNGAQWSVTLTLLDVRKSKREGSDARTAATEAQLLDESRRAARQVVAGLLRARSGTLAVSVSESGATVKLNDIAVGSSPLAAPLSVPAGSHRLTVEKKGFVVSEAEVQIAAAKETQHEVRLLPSEDYAREHAQHHGRLRLGAWIATGVAGAGAIIGGLTQMRAQAIYGDASAQNTFLWYRDRLDAGVEREGDVDYRAEAQRLGEEIRSTEFISQVSLIAAGVAAAGAGFFWIAGEDPDRYKTKPGAVTWRLSPAPGAFAASVQIALP